MIQDYYNDNAATFAESTLCVDMTFTYDKFEQFLKQGDSILDLGCGAGRDSLYFQKRGYHVTALDFSRKLADIACRTTGQEVLVADMREMSFDAEFDAIWACASILHISRNDITEVMIRCRNALKSAGVFYVSFKYGDGEVCRHGRLFNNYNENSLRGLIASVGGFEIIDLFKASDARVGREDEFWLNGFLRKI